MKLISAALLGGALMIAAPAFAADLDQNHNAAMEHRDNDRAVSRHVAYRYSRHHSYKRNYRNDRDEHSATEDLNRQYRGVDRDSVH